MTIFAAIELQTIAAWLFVGLISGWLANKVTEEASYGIAGDLLLGSIGGLTGGVVFAFYGGAFWVGMLVAFVGACILIAGGRVVAAFRRV